MQKSLVKNSVFYMFYNLLNMLFPFITSIYVARILLPASVGEVAYAQNIVSYFSVLAFLGIPTYGVREIAKVRNNKKELSIVFSELFIINGISTFFFSAAYYFFVISVVAKNSNLLLYCVVGLTVILNMLNISWFFEGLEEFGYISLRNAVFKLIMFVLVVLMVKSENDIIQYALISVLGVAGNNIFNIVYSKKFIYFTTKDLNLKRHLRPIFLLLFVNLAIEIYTLVDTTMLGTMSSKENVAYYYYYASKVNKIFLQITNTVTMVLVPRISLYYKEKKMEEFNIVLTKALKIICIMAIPIIVGVQFVAPTAFAGVFGDIYFKSGNVEKILSLVLLISPIGYLLGSRVMLVSNHESKMIFCVGMGAVVNVIGNMILIPRYLEMGAAMASVISEVVVMVLYLQQGRKIFKLGNYQFTVGKALIAGIGEGVSLCVMNKLFGISVSSFVFEGVFAIVVYLIILLLLKEDMIMQYMKLFLMKLRMN